MAQPNKPTNEEFEDVKPIGNEFENVQPIGGQTPSPVEPPTQSWLDKEIPLSSTGAAFEQGAQTLGRGARDAVTGLGSMIAHPINALKSFGEIPGQVAQVPGAIRDINQSTDPAGTYAKVGQETAGQGAGQAGLALATAGLGKVAGPVSRLAGRGLTAISDTVDPDLVGIASPRAGNAMRMAQKAGKILSGKEAPEYPYPVGTTEKIPVTMGKEKLPYRVGAQEKIPTISGEPTPYKVGTQQKIPVRGEMKPFGAASGATGEGGGQLPDVMVVPEPRPPLPGVPPGSMQSVPRADLAGHIMSGTPGALEAGQAIGMKPIILSPGAEFEMGKPVEPPSNVLQFPHESAPAPMNGPEIMDRLGEINRNMQNMGTGTEGVGGAPIRSVPTGEPDVEMIRRGIHPESEEAGEYRRPPALSDEDRARLKEIDEKHTARNAKNAELEKKVKKGEQIE